MVVIVGFDLTYIISQLLESSVQRRDMASAKVSKLGVESIKKLAYKASSIDYASRKLSCADSLPECAWVKPEGYFLSLCCIWAGEDNQLRRLPYLLKGSTLWYSFTGKRVGWDEDGMDLSFTLGRVTVQNTKTRADFMKAMSQARPPDNSIHATDMRQSLGAILDKYLMELKKREKMSGQAKDLTVLVLTDGLWEGKPTKMG
ncbi:hypothetical protein BKA64DRAFT_645361 [Cadophora sp. MPI-SDFR-AT-0126]|nr:hypothetical protein BKA64DRAFT_645361 [Leotiomycetes sp. MPI-SDFR-AT-0126]